LRYISVAGSLDISSTTFTQCASKSTGFADITQNNGRYAVQGHSRSPILVPIERSYATANLPRILHRFRDILRWVQNRYILQRLMGLTAPSEGFPWDDLHKIFCTCQRMAKVPNAVEKLPEISTG